MSRHATRRLEHLVFDLVQTEPRISFVAGQLRRGLARIEAMTMRCGVCNASHAWEPVVKVGETEMVDALAARAECRRWLETHWDCGQTAPVPEHFGGPVQ